MMVLLAATLMACGGPDICLQCPTVTPTATPSVTVTGSGVSVIPNANPSSVTVIICLDLPSGGTAADCTQSFFTDVNTDGTFTRFNVPPGAETIFFWVDANHTGMVDPGETVKLADPQGVLDNVQAGQTVTLSNVIVNFTTKTATADITISLTPTPTPSAVQTTPTPTPLPT